MKKDQHQSCNLSGRSRHSSQRSRPVPPSTEISVDGRFWLDSFDSNWNVSVADLRIRRKLKKAKRNKGRDEARKAEKAARDQIVPRILRSLDGGPKTIVAIMLYLEGREKVQVFELNIIKYLDELIAAGVCQSTDLSHVPGLLDRRTRYRGATRRLYFRTPEAQGSVFGCGFGNWRSS